MNCPCGCGRKFDESRSGRINRRLHFAGVDLTDDQIDRLITVEDTTGCTGDLIDAVISLATSPNVERIQKLRFLPVARL